jgi:CHAT domain-containing protein
MSSRLILASYFLLTCSLMAQAHDANRLCYKGGNLLVEGAYMVHIGEKLDEIVELASDRRYDQAISELIAIEAFGEGAFGRDSRRHPIDKLASHLFLATGDPAKALGHARAASAVSSLCGFPLSVRVDDLMLVGLTQMAINNLSEATSTIMSASSLCVSSSDCPDNVKVGVLVALGKVLREGSKALDAVGVLEKALSLVPLLKNDSFDLVTLVRVELMLAYEASGNTKRADHLLRTKLTPQISLRSAWSFMCSKALVLLRRRRVLEAKQEILTLVRLHPPTEAVPPELLATASSLLTQIYAHEGLFGHARECGVSSMETAIKYMDWMSYGGSELDKLQIYGAMSLVKHRVIHVAYTYQMRDPLMARLASEVVDMWQGRVTRATISGNFAFRTRLGERFVPILQEGPPPQVSPLCELGSRRTTTATEYSLSDVATLAYGIFRPGKVSFPNMEQDFDSEKYIAIVTTNQTSRVLVELPAAEEVDSLVKVYRDVLRDSRIPIEILQDHAKALDRAIFAPLTKHIRLAKNLLIIPDGSMNIVPFAALVDDEGHFRVQKYSFRFADPGLAKDASGFKRPGQIRKKDIVVFGGVDYGNSLASSRIRWESLSGTQEEAKQISARFGHVVHHRTGLKATETFLKHIHRPSLIHLATHGYSGDASEDVRTTYSGLFSDRAAITSLHFTMKASFLALARANEGTDGLGNDGILTAAELLDLDWSDCELIVLSACRTAIGGITEGQGLYGLRRALVLTGVRSQLLTLWLVDDKAAVQMMDRFYEGLLAGESKSIALQRAQQKAAEMLHPFYWGSLVLFGDDRPIKVVD